MTMPASPSRRTLLGFLAGTPWLLAGCGGADVFTSPGGAVLAEAPVYHLGDRWSWHVGQRFRTPPSHDETAEVTAASPDGLVVTVTAKGEGLDITRTERWKAPGLVVQGALMAVETRRFVEPLQRLRFPLTSGGRWNQVVGQVNETEKLEGPINRYVDVRGLERVATPAGTFDAVRMNVLMRLDDETPFRYATQAAHTIWYAPAVRAIVREDRRAHYIEKGTSRSEPFPDVPVQAELVELVSFTPGR